jgi:hypothetical protein
MNLKMILTILTFMTLAACGTIRSTNSGQTVPTEIDQKISLEDQAQAALVEFFAALNAGEYAQAALLYGGSYETLQGFNPDVDPNDQTSLMRAGCTINGLMCLPVLDLTFVAGNDQQAFVFDVAFANPDGSQFVLGPCCGATEEEMPPVSVFQVNVTCQPNSTCSVLDLPPYVP